MKHPPPVQWLVPFAMAAREMSFRRAADSLSITPSAVSQQVRALEEWIGTPLFHRNPRALGLTQAGVQLADLAQQVLSSYQSGFGRFARAFCSTSVSIASDQFVAHEWLFPRLAAFYEQRPELHMQVEATVDPHDLSIDSHELAIQFTSAPESRLWTRELTPVLAVPVCAPQLLGGVPVTEPAALGKFPLIHALDRPDPWSQLATELGVSWTQARRGFRSHYDSMRAAEQSLGIAFGLMPLVKPWLDSGRLMLATDWKLRIPYGYRVVSRLADAERMEVRLVANWIQSWFPTLSDAPELSKLRTFEANLSL